MSIYRGPRRKLVLAFDVGTAFSGISYSVLDPGQVPEIKGVARFPAQEHVSRGGASKIPTVIYYDRSGKVRAVGAETTKEDIWEVAEDENWVKAEWFGLHLRSGVGASRSVSIELPPLPLNKTVVEIFGDFLRYLLECASSYIQDAHADDPDLWSSVKSHIDFVISHPNGWDGTQQNEMRRDAVLGGLVPDNASGHSRLSFVTEGEASLHFSVQNGLPAGAMKNGDGVVIVDAGGGTVDISSYSRNQKGDIEEISAPQCYFHGSLFVTIHAKRFLENFLADSPFLDDLDHIVGCFDKTTKLRFRNAEEPQYIRFGSTRDNDWVHNIRFGQLKLKGTDVASFFEPSVDCIVKAILDQRKSAHKAISHVVLVGSFAPSDWLFIKVQEALTPLGLNVLRPEDPTNKAVSDGAVSFYLDHFVRTRVSKLTYGHFCHIPYNTSDSSHTARVSKTFISTSGSRLISDYFDVILPLNTQVSEAKEFRRTYSREMEFLNDLKSISFSVWCYRGMVASPKWKDVDTDNYTKLCSIEADLSHLSSRNKTSGVGTFYRLDYELVILFGLTEIKAQVVYKDNGVEKRTAAKIVYDPDTVDDEPISVPVSESIPSVSWEPGSTGISAPECPSTDIPQQNTYYPFQGANVYMDRPIIANTIILHTEDERSRSQILLNNGSSTQAIRPMS